MPPIGTRAPSAFIDSSAAPARRPKLLREYHARNSVTRSVSPHRMRPIHASQAVSSWPVMSENISSARGSELDNMPTALPKSPAKWSVMFPRTSLRGRLHGRR